MQAIKTPNTPRAKREIEKRAPKLFGSHSKKRPNNLVLGRTYDHHIYDLVEVGIENFKSMESFSYDKKLGPRVGSKPFITFIGDGFENVEELKHLKEVLLDLFREEMKNVGRDAIQGKIGKIYIPNQKVAGMTLSHKVKGLKRERREAKGHMSKKLKAEHL